MAWFYLILAAVLNAGGSLFLKRAQIVVLGMPAPGMMSFWTVAGLTCFAGNVLIYAQALKDLPVTLSYPVLTGCCFTIICFVSYFWFQERMNFSSLIGSGLVLVGVILIAQSHNSSQ